MAVYKVIQDVEAEDKLVGPLTLRGFIYALIALACGFINFKLLMIGTPIKWVLILMFLMPMLLFGVLASPLGREQPTEVWLLSKLKFFLKPRKRAWDQDGIEELVTITVPKQIQQHLTKEFSQNEVHSRLKTLASTLDTRGWAIKNVDLNLNIEPMQLAATTVPSDRLVNNSGYSQPVQTIDVRAADDIMDEQNNPTAQKFASMMQTADDHRKRGVLKTIKGALSDDSKESSNDILDDLAKARESFSKQHTKGAKKPDSNHKILTAKKNTQIPKATPVTPEHQAVNMELAQSGSAFSVATLSQLANRQPSSEQTGPGEVTISLH